MWKTRGNTREYHTRCVFECRGKKEVRGYIIPIKRNSKKWVFRSPRRMICYFTKKLEGKFYISINRNVYRIIPIEIDIPIMEQVEKGMYRIRLYPERIYHEKEADIREFIENDMKQLNELMANSTNEEDE